MLSSAFGGNINQQDISNMTQGYMTEISSAITTDTSKAQTTFTNNLVTITKNMLKDYITKNHVAGVATIALKDVETVVNEYMAGYTTKELLAKLEVNILFHKMYFHQLIHRL